MSRLGFILLLVLLIAVYLVGYWPQHAQLAQAHQELQTTQAALEDAKSRLEIYGMSDRLFLLIQKTNEKNYGDAQKLSSEFFDRVRAEISKTADAQRKAVLQAVLEKRDSITASLAKGDPANAETLSQIMQQLRKLIEPGAPAPSSQAPAAKD